MMADVSQVRPSAETPKGAMKKIVTPTAVAFFTAVFFLSGCSVTLPWVGEEEPPPAATLATYQPGGTPESAGETVDVNEAENVAAEEPEVTAANVVSQSEPAEDAGALAYTGEIVADQQVAVTAEVAGQIVELTVDVGDRVAAGDLLVRIDSTTLAAQREQALAGLLAAQAQLDLLLEDPEASELEAARAAVNAASEAYQQIQAGPKEEDLVIAESQLRQAEAAVARAQAAYDRVAWNPAIAALPESEQLQQATLQLEAAQAQYDKVVQGATADAIAAAYAQLAQARAQLERLEQGAKAAQIEAAEAQVKQAETALYLAQLQLEKATVEAPVDSVVAQVQTSVGSMAAPGAPLVLLLSEQVKIVIAVEERRLGEIEIGQPATLRVDAYPDRTFAGTITNIAPAVDASTRTVQVTIRPAAETPVLKQGMSALVSLGGIAQ